ncbi:MAG: hypothetical protein L0Y50_06420 [Beijerinckiaceae bacterium]|nr:hypothetical protein [Beijerinckiaceae bacterium]
MILVPDEDFVTGFSGDAELTALGRHLAALEKRAEKRRRSSMAELSFQGIDPSCLPEQTKV